VISDHSTPPKIFFAWWGLNKIYLVTYMHLFFSIYSLNYIHLRCPLISLMMIIRPLVIIIIIIIIKKVLFKVTLLRKRCGYFTDSTLLKC